MKWIARARWSVQFDDMASAVRQGADLSLRCQCATRRVLVPGLVACAAAASAVRDARAADPAPVPAPVAAASAPIDLGRVYVPGTRLIDVGPLPGLQITRDQIPANIQSVTREELKASRALHIGEYMNTHLQGVTINDYAGNPFQFDVNYRGFTASPQIGTPQGLSIFFDGVRVNEPFGDVVNWDLIPTNAIERLDLIPGSNPLYGLNTLGGAISLRSKSGFTSPGVDGEVMAGSWGRTQIKLGAGGSNGPLAGFLAYTGFHESGWRDNSPSTVNQTFARGDLDLDRGSMFVSGLYADNTLIGNGLIPLSSYEQRPESVLTSPDRATNRALQLTLGGQLDLTQKSNIAGQVYMRDSKREGLNGDLYEGFDDLTGPDTAYQDPVTGALTPRNGAVYGLPGEITGTPVGLLSTTSLDQKVRGGSVQFNWNGTDHKAMAGGSIDRDESTYSLYQQLALIGATHNVGAAPDELSNYLAGKMPLPLNSFSGTSTTRSLFASDTWAVASKLTLSTAVRYNVTDVDNHLDVLTPKRGNNLDAILSAGDFNTTHTDDAFQYRSFNPSIGVNFVPRPELNIYGSVGRGARTPSVVELGCAYDGTLVDYNAGGGVPSMAGGSLAPRSLVGPTCNLPTTLSGDPFLPQIRSTAYELGARGNVTRTLEWDVSLFQTDLKNDIYFVGAGVGRSFFDTIDKTRRRGIELGFKGVVGPVAVNGSYSYTAATFQSQFYELSPYNSTADFNQNSGANAQVQYNDYILLPTANASKNNGRGTFEQILVTPGSRMPGIPAHAANLNASFKPISAWKIGLGMQARSFSYARGNENNAHQPNGTDQQIGEYYCPQPCSATGGEGFAQFPVRPGRAFTQKGTVPGFAVFNFDTSYELGRGLGIFAQVTNLFDRRYFSAARLGVNPFAKSTIGAIGASGYNYNSSEWQNSTLVGPGAPRGIFFGLTYTTGGK